MHLNHKSNRIFRSLTTAKRSKKVVKRATDGEETQTAKQEVFVVTPSRNIEEYLAEIKRSNLASLFRSSSEANQALTSTDAPVLSDETSTDVPASTTQPEVPSTKESSTETATIPTLSTNPFQAPNDEVTIPVFIKHDEDTTPSLKALLEPETFDTTSASPIEISTSSETSLKAEIIEADKITDTPQAITEPATIFTTTTAESTTIKTTTEKDDSDESDESEEDGMVNYDCTINKNL